MKHPAKGVLSFDSTDHVYRWNGRRVPCVSDIIGRVTDYAGVPKKHLERASAIGTAVHQACEFDDLGILDYEAIDPIIEPMLTAWQRFRADYLTEWLSVEDRAYSLRHDFAGTPDREGFINSDEAIIDIKTTQKIGPWVGLQLAGYEILKGYNPTKPKKRIAVQLKRDGTYEIHRFNMATDHATFQSLLTLYKWEQLNMKEHSK